MAQSTATIKPDSIAQAIQNSTASSSLWADFQKFSRNRVNRLKKTVLGDYYYEPKNKFKAVYKQKIFRYLQAKYMTTLSQLEDQIPKKFTSFDDNYGNNIQFQSLKHMKEVLLKLKTNIEAAQDAVSQSQIAVEQLKANFLNETAYEFDKQRKTSTAWGLLLGAFICSTVYRKGSSIRKAAVFFTTGLVFNEISYRWNVDKYFDTVYPIFEEDALEFVRAEERQNIQKEVVKIRGESVIEG